MAIRYSGDVEVAITSTLDPHTYRARVRWPGGSHVAMIQSNKKRTTELYDELSYRAILSARAKYTLPLEYDGKNIGIRRVFQAACPIKV